MTDLSPETAALVKRRLTGLVVLLLLAFLFGLLQHDGAGDKAAQGLKSVVIPLNGDAPALITPAENMATTELPATDEAAVLPAEEPAVATTPPAPIVKAPPPAPPAKPAAKVATPAKPKSSAPAIAAIKPARPQRWFVVVGAFKDAAAASAIANRVKLAGFKVEATAITSAGARLTRVRAGPFSTVDKAESARATLIVEGLTKAAVVTEK